MKNILYITENRQINSCNFNKFTNAIHALRILDEHVMFYMLEGQWEIFEDGNVYNIGKDDVLFLHSGHHHYGLRPGSNVIRTCFIHFTPLQNDFLSADSPQKKNNIDDWIIEIDTVTHCGNTPNVKALFEELIKIFYSDNTYKHIGIAGKLNSLLYELANISLAKQPHDPIILKIIDQISNNPSKFYKLEELAEEYFICQKTLSSHFKEECGISLHQYQLALKLKMADFLMKSNPEITLKEISGQFGFYDEYHFCKSYKKHYGLSPKNKK